MVWSEVEGPSANESERKRNGNKNKLQNEIISFAQKTTREYYKTSGELCRPDREFDVCWDYAAKSATHTFTCERNGASAFLFTNSTLCTLHTFATATAVSKRLRGHPFRRRRRFGIEMRTHTLFTHTTFPTWKSENRDKSLRFEILEKNQKFCLRLFDASAIGSISFQTEHTHARTA